MNERELKMVAWLKLGRVAGIISPNFNILFMNGKNIKQIRAEQPSLSQDLKLQAVEWSLKLSQTLMI